MPQSYLPESEPSGRGFDPLEGGIAPPAPEAGTRAEEAAVLPLGLHVALIMDGNGRWARGRGLPRVVGHREGARAVRRVVEAAPGLSIGTLTLFAFSGDNWQRPGAEVAALMRLFEDYLNQEKEACAARGIRVRVIGRRDRLDAALLRAVEAAEAATAGGARMQLRIAVDYSAREAIVAAARLASRQRLPELTREGFRSLMAAASHVPEPAPDVDLLVRSGGEQRLSDCLLWDIAYAEIVFSERMWPDFSGDDLAAAITEFHQRERRYGRIPELAAG